MSIIPPSLVKVYAEQLGHSGTDFDEEVLTALAQEVDYRLRELIQNASKFMIHSKRAKLTVDDLNAALKDANQPLLYGYDPMEQLVFRAVPNSDLFYVPGEEVSLLDILQEPLPRAPLAPAMTCHALAIEGVQPAIPENPVMHGEKVDLGPTTASAAKTVAAPTRRELVEEAEVKPLARHVLSKELQLFFDTLINDLLSFEQKPECSAAALKSLESDAGLQQLLPYLLQFIAEGVPKHLRSAPRLLLLMQATTALIKNPYLYIEPYLHQLMPPVLTCLVGKRLSEEPGDLIQWEVRNEAASIIAAVCAVYGTVYSNMMPRIAKTLLKALLDNEKPLTTHYGAIAGIAALGPQAIDSLLLPCITQYLEALNIKAHLNSSEHVKVYNALEKCANLWHSSFDTVNEPKMLESKDLLDRLFKSMQD